nr:MAG TPA: Baseplate wedge protein [Caudoviricetes sp.]
MSNAVKKAILQKKVEGVVTDLMVKTSAENVVVDDTGKTLSTELAEIITAMAGKATASDIDTRINALIGAAPTALDTLVEIADALNNDPDFAATMTTQLAGKVDKVAGKGLSTEDFTTALKQKLEGITGYTHPDSHPATMITQDATHRFVTDAEKTAWNAKGRILSGTTTPADLAETDLFLQIVD